MYQIQVVLIYIVQQCTQKITSLILESFLFIGTGSIFPKSSSTRNHSPKGWKKEIWVLKYLFQNPPFNNKELYEITVQIS